MGLYWINHQSIGFHSICGRTGREKCFFSCIQGRILLHKWIATGKWHLQQAPRAPHHVELNNTVTSMMFVTTFCVVSDLLSPSLSLSTSVCRQQNCERLLHCNMKFSLIVPLLISGVAGRASFSRIATSFGLDRQVGRKSNEANYLDTLLELRGGAARRKSKSRVSSLSKKTATGKKKVGAKKAEEESTVKDLLEKYKRILPLTRIYITMVVGFTLLGLVLGDELSQGILALDPMRVLYGAEIWRMFTAAAFLGPPSVGWLMSGYYLFSYGSSLELAYGTAQYLIFLLSQVVILSAMSALCGLPFFANSMIAAMLHVLSRTLPHQEVKWLVFKVKYWALPSCFMAMSVLEAGSAAAAVPHILGILSGHFYHYQRFIWPKTDGGQDWLSAPDFLVNFLDPNAASKNSAKGSLNKILKSRKRGKGKKLGR
jgi:derlin-1